MMPCPRRNETALIITPPNEDRWRGADEPRPHTCTYCGSLHPDEVLRRIEAGQEVSPTDKSYKMYLDQASPNWAKVYFQHFSPEHQAKLVQLVNAKAVKFAYPGHFYVLPFFMKIQ